MKMAWANNKLEKNFEEGLHPSSLPLSVRPRVKKGLVFTSNGVWVWDIIRVVRVHVRVKINQRVVISTESELQEYEGFHFLLIAPMNDSVAYNLVQTRLSHMLKQINQSQCTFPSYDSTI